MTDLLAGGRPLQPRDAAMLAMLYGGATLRAVGRTFGISGERVRQIVARAGFTREDAARAATIRGQRKAAARAAERAAAAAELEALRAAQRARYRAAQRQRRLEQVVAVRALAQRVPGGILTAREIEQVVGHGGMSVAVWTGQRPGLYAGQEGAYRNAMRRIARLAGVAVCDGRAAKGLRGGSAALSLAQREAALRWDFRR